MPSILSDASINSNKAEEADQKLIRHMIQCVENNGKDITIKTVDRKFRMVILASCKPALCSEVYDV